MDTWSSPSEMHCSLGDIETVNHATNICYAGAGIQRWIKRHASSTRCFPSTCQSHCDDSDAESCTQGRGSRTEGETSLEAVRPRLFISAIYYMFSRIKQLEAEYRYLLLSRIMLKPIFKHWEILKNIFLRVFLY